ncbi:hypothetical protein TNCV_2073331 [Trichonephila clavipes]|uniref:Uncharacterized protein n=1 Tax=Trichonephila clavipes TaxID=2585209 RepID=A0A8X6R974_TRICX|nr:hypothetical protein TNCV_2073331 [Trichonephila clavipes]
MRVVSVPQSILKASKFAEVGAQFHRNIIMERERYSCHELFSWGGITLNRLTELYAFDIGPITRFRY